jgi:hypothetical protein
VGCLLGALGWERLLIAFVCINICLFGTRESWMGNRGCGSVGGEIGGALGHLGYWAGVFKAWIGHE